MIDRVVFSRLATVPAVNLEWIARVTTVFVLVGGAGCLGEPVAPGDPRGTIRGQVQVDGAGTRTAVLIVGGTARDPVRYVVPTDGEGRYSYDLPPGDWSLRGVHPRAACSYETTHIADGGESVRDLGCTTVDGTWTRSHHQVAGTCNDPVGDFDVTMHASTRENGDRTDMELAYEGGSDETKVSGTFDPETDRFTGKSGRDDSGSGFFVEERVEMEITRQADGGLLFSGQAFVQFLLLSGAVICTKTFDIDGHRL